MDDKNKLYASTEIIGAVLINSISSADIDEFASNPQDCLNANFDIDVSHIDFNVIENSDSDVNLILPYYDSIEEFRAAKLKDEKLSNISGGEIFITLGTFLGVGIALGVGSAIAGGAVGASVGIAGGVIGAAVGVAATGAVIGTAVEKSK